MTDRDRIRLVVLFGGQSAEHDVSRVSARHVLAATDPERYDVRAVGITREGEWLLGEETARALADGPGALPEALEVEGRSVEPLPMLSAEPGEEVVVFPLLHGPMGEDGTVQGLLELAGVAYVGCGVLASALAMDKAKAKEVLAFHEVPQARWVARNAADLASDPDSLSRIGAELGFPIFVKPANMGSSIGVSRADELTSLATATELAARYDEWLLFEEGVDVREIECAVLGNTNPRASVPGEVVPAGDFYDFADKYVDGAAELVIPAALSPEVTKEIRELALVAFGALRAEGLARVDFFYEEGGRGVLLNEVNTMPGFTPISMYPRLWEASGLPYGELIDELVGLAIERRDRRRRHRTT